MNEVAVEKISEVTFLRKTYAGSALVRAEIVHRGKRTGWRICPYKHDAHSLAYMSSDGLGAYIHSGSEVSFYDAWSDGERSTRKIAREPWIEECLDDMRRDARSIASTSKRTTGAKKKERTTRAAASRRDHEAVRALNNEAHFLIADGKHEEARSVLAKIREMLEARGEIVVDKAHLPDVQNWYFFLQRELELAWHDARYDEKREDAARAYVLENALCVLTSTWNRCDPKGARIANEEYVYSYGLWAILSFQTRTGHHAEATQLLASELEDTSRMELRLHARRAQTECALNAALCIFIEHPEKAKAIADAKPTFHRMVEIVGAPETGLLAHQFACFHVFYGEMAAARSMALRAVQKGIDRSVLEADPDLAPLFAKA